MTRSHQSSGGSHLLLKALQVTLGSGWVKSLFKRMNFVRRKKTTSTKPKMISEVRDQLQRDYQQNIYTVQQSAMVPQQLIVNIDQTPVKMVPVSEYTMSEKGAECVSVIGGDDKKMFTAVFSVTMNGKFLPMQLIYGLTERCHPKMDFLVGFHVTHNPKHWSNLTQPRSCRLKSSYRTQIK